MDTVVVAGATGYLGRHLVAELHARGYRTRAVVRSRSRAEQPGPYRSPSLAGLVDEWAQGDVTAPAFVRGVAEGAAHVVSALGVTRQKASPWDIDFLANLSLLQEAERAAVRSFLYVNVMHAEIGRSLLLRAKRAFAEALERSSVTHQIVNPSGYFSDISEYLAMARSGVAVLPPDPELRVAPIHGADLATYCVDRLSGPSGSWDVGGPDVLTYREIARLAFDAVGRKPRLVRVPMGAVRAGVWVASRFGERPRSLAEFFADGLVTEAVGERTGTHHLAAHFAELARAGKASR